VPGDILTAVELSESTASLKIVSPLQQTELLL